MKQRHLTTLLFFIAVFAFFPNLYAASKDQCVACHSDLDDENLAVVKGYQEGIHAREGISCAGCHGGDPTIDDMDAMDPSKGFAGAPSHREIPRFCGKCHSDANYMRHYNPTLPIDQEEKYYTSQHYKKLKKGDHKVATCISCHGVHGILPPENVNSPVHELNVPSTCNRCHGDAKYMKEYGIPTGQYAEYSQSVHGVAVLQKHLKGAPVCNDCHGNHGAAPPGVDDVAAVCVTCHTFPGELFNESPHRAAFKEKGIIQCAACHNKHLILHPTDAMLGIDVGAVCIKCHKPGDPGFIEARLMKQTLDSLITEQNRAKAALDRAKALDMDVSDGETVLETARENIIESRTATHAASNKHLAEVADKGFEAEQSAIEIANNAVYEYKFRRTGFGIATLILTGLALMLYLKIRQIERRQKEERDRKEG